MRPASSRGAHGKLLKTDKGLRALFHLISSVAALMNVGSLLVLLFFVFAVMGMNLFSDADRDGEFITNYNNFESFGYSMLTLFFAASRART